MSGFYVGEDRLSPAPVFGVALSAGCTDGAAGLLHWSREAVRPVSFPERGGIIVLAAARSGVGPGCSMTWGVVFRRVLSASPAV